MTKSLALVIGDQPEELLLQRREGCTYGSEEVTDDLRALVSEIEKRPSPSGISPSREFKAKLAVKSAIREFFGDGSCQVYEQRREVPEPPITHSCVVINDGEIVSAYRRVEIEETESSSSSLPFNHPFDYWLTPDIAYLPLRSDAKEEPYDPKTWVCGKEPYYSGWASSNSAVLADVDIGKIKKAREETTCDLLSKARHILETEGLDAHFDWRPRYTTDWGDTKEDPTYFEQTKPRLLHERMPDHARRIDYLLAGEEDLMLYSDWGAIPVASVLSQDGYATMHNYSPKDTSHDALFFQITGTNRSFLKTLRNVFSKSEPDTLLSVYRVHE